VDPGAANKQPVKRAIAILHPTAGSKASGVVRFVDVGGRGLDVFAVVHGLDARVHAYHVHVFGDCSSGDAKSAGPHFNFLGSSFDDEVGMITGNLGHVQRHKTGPTSTHQGRVEDASLQGEFSIIGRAVVVHERGNDPSVTPDGDAGARIACGVIGVANPSAQQTAGR
jgi:Cu-Zn family superoxide dismutase